MRRSRISFKDLGDYIIYPDGRVFGKKRGHFIVQIMGSQKSKYFTVKIPKRVKVHRLVAESFVPNPNNKPEVNHIDGNKENNNFWNLEWVTRLENIQHSHRIGLRNVKGENSPTAKLDIVSVRIIRDCLDAGFSQTKIARYFKVDPTTISNIKTGLTWR